MLSKRLFCKNPPRRLIIDSETSEEADEVKLLLRLARNADPFDRKRGNIRRYKDKLDRWENPHGKKLAREHLRKAFEDKLPVRLVSVVLDDSRNVNAKRKQCKPSVCADEVGRVIKFDGDNFVIAFQKTAN